MVIDHVISGHVTLEFAFAWCSVTKTIDSSLSSMSDADCLSATTRRKCPMMAGKFSSGFTRDGFSHSSIADDVVSTNCRLVNEIKPHLITRSTRLSSSLFNSTSHELKIMIQQTKISSKKTQTGMMQVQLKYRKKTMHTGLCHQWHTAWAKNNGTMYGILKYDNRCHRFTCAIRKVSLYKNISQAVFLAIIVIS